MTLRALGTRIIIDRIAGRRETAGGIVLQNDIERPHAKVISIGQQVTEDVAVGDIVVVDWTRVGTFRFENSQHYIMDQSALIAVLS